MAERVRKGQRVIVMIGQGAGPGIVTQVHSNNQVTVTTTVGTARVGNHPDFVRASAFPNDPTNIAAWEHIESELAND